MKTKMTTLEDVLNRQKILDLMDVSLSDKFEFVEWNKFKTGDLATGFFSEEDILPICAFQCKPGTKLNYWDILTLAIRKGMDFKDRLHYYRMVMDVAKKFVNRDACYGEWELMKDGFSRGITYGLNNCGHLTVYALDYSVASGRGFSAKLTTNGLAKRHEEFASYHFLSDRKKLTSTRGVAVDLPRAYYDDEILRNIPYTIFEDSCCIHFEDNGIAKGTIKEQAYESILPILFHRPKAKVAVNIVASIEVTASLLVGKRGGRMISVIEKEKIKKRTDCARYDFLLHEQYKGLLGMLYSCDIEGIIFKESGMKTSDGMPIGCVYFVG